MMLNIIGLFAFLLPLSRAGSVSKNFVACCELVQEIGGYLEYQKDGRFLENHCITVMKDLGPCFSACKDMHHGKAIDNASPNEEAAHVHHQVVVLTSHFSSSHSHVHEIEQSICANLVNPHVGKLIMMFEGTEGGCKQMLLRFPTRKFVCRSLPYQPRYSDLFKAANHLPAGTLAIISNSDVVFDHSLQMLWPEALRATPTMFVLSTQPPEGAGYRGQYVDFVGERCSNDKLPTNKCYKEGPCPGCTWEAFVFASPLASTVDFSSLNIHMNVVGAENKVGLALENAGVMLMNPCLHIKAHHWHCEARSKEVVTKSGFSDLHIAPCENCPFLRPYKAVGAPHSSPNTVSMRGGGGAKGGGRGKPRPHHRQLLGSSIELDRSISGSSDQARFQTQTVTDPTHHFELSFHEWKLNRILSRFLLEQSKEGRRRTSDVHGGSSFSKNNTVLSSHKPRYLKEQMTNEVKKYIELQRSNRAKVVPQADASDGATGSSSMLRVHHPHGISAEARRKQISPLKLFEAGIISEEELKLISSRSHPPASNLEHEAIRNTPHLSPGASGDGDKAGGVDEAARAKNAAVQARVRARIKAREEEAQATV